MAPAALLAQLSRNQGQDNGLAAPSCNQLHFPPQLNDRLRLLMLTYSITLAALKDSPRNSHK
jgi:hypothetical protein